MVAALVADPKQFNRCWQPCELDWVENDTPNSCDPYIVQVRVEVDHDWTAIHWVTIDTEGTRRKGLRLDIFANHKCRN